MVIVFGLITQAYAVRGYYGTTGNENQMTRVIMDKIVPKLITAEIRRVTLRMEHDIDLHCKRTATDLIFICAATNQYPVRICWEMLESLEQEYGDIAGQSGPSVNRIIRDKIRYYNDPTNDRVMMLRQQTQEVRDTMIVNIESVLERGEQLTELVEKTEVTQEEAREFAKKSRKLKWKMIRQYLAILCCLAVIVTLLLAALALIVAAIATAIAAAAAGPISGAVGGRGGGGTGGGGGGGGTGGGNLNAKILM